MFSLASGQANVSTAGSGNFDLGIAPQVQRMKRNIHMLHAAYD